MKNSFKFLAAPFFILALWMPLHAHAARYLFSPVSGSYQSGGRFAVQIIIDTESVAINAAEGTLSFPTRFLQVESISTDGSVFKFWSQDPAFSNSSGNITFGGGLPSPGVISPSARVLTIFFRAVGGGDGVLRVESGSVLANDGVGTNVLNSSQEGRYKVALGNVPPVEAQPANGVPAAPRVNSPTHPQEDAWYNGNTFEADWSPPANITALNYELNDQSDYVLPSTANNLVNRAVFDLKNYPDGIWYFYIRYKNRSGWGEETQRVVRTDRTPPQEFSVSRKDDGSAAQPLLAFDSSDVTSGIDRYEIKIDGGDWVGANKFSSGGNYLLPAMSQGNHDISVRAYDNAGNYTEEKTTVRITGSGPYKAPPFLFLLQWGGLSVVALLIIGLLIAVGYLLLHNFQMWRTLMRRDLRKLKEELHEDLRDLEKELEPLAGSASLGAGEIRRMRERIRSKVKNLESDVESEIKNLDKVSG